MAQTQINEFTDADIDDWIKWELNVLITGPAGTGKTTRLLDACKRNGLSYLYFSAPTLDPYIDFVGVPKVAIDKESGQEYLKFVLPKLLAMDSVDIIILDELPRAHIKTINACMELIQFKSINGRPFHKLKMVWGLANPVDDTGTYHGNNLDLAQRDRFQIHVDVNPEPSLDYFKSVKEYTDYAEPLVEWWGKQSENIKDIVSPRRLEYAMKHYLKGGNLRHILPRGANIVELLQALDSKQSMEMRLTKLQLAPYAEQVAFFENESNYGSALQVIIDDAEKREKGYGFAKQFFRAFGFEKQASLITVAGNQQKIYAWYDVKEDIMIHIEDNENYQKLMREMILAGKDTDLIQGFEAEFKDRHQEEWKDAIAAFEANMFSGK